MDEDPILQDYVFGTPLSHSQSDGLSGALNPKCGYRGMFLDCSSEANSNYEKSVQLTAWPLGVEFRPATPHVLLPDLCNVSTLDLPLLQLR